MKKVLFILLFSIFPVFLSCEKEDPIIIMKHSILDIFFDKDGGTQIIVQGKEQKGDLYVRWIYDECADVKYMGECVDKDYPTFAKANGITVTIDAKDRFIVTVEPSQEFHSWETITSAGYIIVTQK